MFRKAMLYLGLGPDEEYDDYEPGDDEGGERQPGRAPAQRPARTGSGSTASGASAYADEHSAIGAVRPINPRVDARSEEGPSKPATGQTVTPSGGPRPRPQVVRTIAVTPNAKPHVVRPVSFNEAQELADKFRGNQPVIMNLQGAERDLSRRLIDFASGLCYGLGGQMEKVANQVYLLTPSNVEVSAEERRRLQERGYDG